MKIRNFFKIGYLEPKIFFDINIKQKNKINSNKFNSNTIIQTFNFFFITTVENKKIITIQINNYDLETLEEGKFINDTIIWFFLK